MSARKWKLTYSNIVATLALALVLAGGTAYAAQKLVTSSKQIARGVVTNGKVKPGTLQADKLSPEALAELDGAQGPEGPEGAEGPAGPQGLPGKIGPRGPAGATDVAIRTADEPLGADSARLLRVQCPAGETAVGGGVALVQGDDLSFRVSDSRPIAAGGGAVDGDRPTGWGAFVVNESLDPDDVYEVRVYALCASP